MPLALGGTWDRARDLTVVAFTKYGVLRTVYSAQLAEENLSSSSLVTPRYLIYVTPLAPNRAIIATTLAGRSSPRGMDWVTTQGDFPM